MCQYHQNLTSSVGKNIGHIDNGNENYKKGNILPLPNIMCTLGDEKRVVQDWQFGSNAIYLQYTTSTFNKICKFIIKLIKRTYISEIFIFTSDLSETIYCIVIYLHPDWKDTNNSKPNVFSFQLLIRYSRTKD